CRHDIARKKRARRFLRRDPAAAARRRGLFDGPGADHLDHHDDGAGRRVGGGAVGAQGLHLERLPTPASRRPFEPPPVEGGRHHAWRRRSPAGAGILRHERSDPTHDDQELRLRRHHRPRWAARRRHHRRRFAPPHGRRAVARRRVAGDEPAAQDHPAAGARRRGGGGDERTRHHQPVRGGRPGQAAGHPAYPRLPARGRGMKSPLDIAFERARLSIARNGGAGTRRRYSRFVGLAKRILPATALALLLLVAVWPRFQAAIDSVHFTSLPKIDTSEAQDVRMVAARYSGLDRENRPFIVTAEVAHQTPKADDAIALDGPKADMTTLSGNWNELTAYVGLYQPQSQLLDLFGNVELYQDKGN